MQTALRMLTKAIYGVVGAVFLVGAALVLLVNTGLLPDAVRNGVIEESEGNLNTLHVGQEFAAPLVFAGLMTFWFVRHYEQSKVFHWSMTIFLGLMALVHWFDVRGPLDSVAGPSINTIPFALFVLLGLLRRREKSERHKGTEEKKPEHQGREREAARPVGPLSATFP